MQKICQQLVESAMALGADAADAICMETTSIGANVYDGEVESFTHSLMRGAGVRVIKDQRVGYAYTENPEEIASTAQAALQSAAITDADPAACIFEGPGIESTALPVQEMDEAAVVQAALQLFAALKARGAVNTQGCEAETEQSRIWFANSAGVCGSYGQNASALVAQPVAKKGDWTDSNWAFDVAETMDALDIESTAQRAMDRTMAYYGATSIPSGKMPVVLAGEAMADLLQAFVPVFSADQAQKGLSFLKGKEGQVIAKPDITLWDDPQHPTLPFATPFDGEGMPTHKKAVIDHGTLTTLLHSATTAKRAGVAPTGNARRGYSSSVVIGPYYFYIEPGHDDAQVLYEKAQNGVFIKEVSGLHAGVNAVSGDFSLLSKGQRIVDGQLGAPVEQIVLSGNFYALLQSVEGIGNDLYMGIPSGMCFGSPSLLVSGLSIAGQ